MPSPFPGMDPFLEDPPTWPNFHAAMIGEIQAALNRTLRPKYAARIEERVYISDEDDPGRQLIAPDVRIVEIDQSRPRSAVQVSPTSLLEVDESIIATTVLIDNAVRERYVAVMDTATRRVVTIIEVLSPTNKCVGAKGRKQYMRKRRKILASTCHLVEIDLLRTGKATFPRTILPPHDYAVHASRAEDRPEARLWPIRLQRRLPVIEIPLKKEDADAKLDLQALFAEAYDRGANDLAIDYMRPCVPALPAELETWAKKLIAAS